MTRDPWLLLHPDGEGGGEGGGSSQEEEATAPPEGEAETQGGSGDGQTQMVPASEAQEARKEAKNLRQRMKAIEKERDELKGAQMSDAEKTTEERDKLREQAKTLAESNRTLRVQVLSSKVGIIDPEAASALLDWSKITDPEDDAEVEQALREMVKEKTYLAGNVAGGGDGGAGGGSGEVVDMNQALRRAAGRA